jgi:NAD(P)-dependent dehydrogenase (short-subunit alcohol dehydrogenase family)
MLKLMKRRAVDWYGDESRWEELYDKYPGKRPATAEEVADLILFLASPRAGYITGDEITVDGGFSRMLLSLIPRAGYEAPAKDAG